MSLSNYMEWRFLNAFFDQLALPSGLGDPHWIGLCTDTPHEDGSENHEVSGGDYGRVDTYSADWNTPDLDGDLKSFVDNKEAIIFPEALANWGTIAYFALFNAETAGALLIWGTLGEPREVPTGSIPRFDPGTLKVYLA